jgi:NAD+--asparagine ADP-ribosyltransferase
LDDDESYNFDFTFSNVDKKTILKNAKALLSKEQYDELLKKEGLASSQMVSWIKENDKEKFWLFVSSLTNDIDNYGKILEFLDWELETETSDEDDEAIDFND